jgi:hypothetical protein
MDCVNIKPILAAIKYLCDKSPHLYYSSQRDGIVNLYQWYDPYCQGLKQWNKSLTINMYTNQMDGRLD